MIIHAGDYCSAEIQNFLMGYKEFAGVRGNVFSTVMVTKERRPITRKRRERWAWYILLELSKSTVNAELRFIQD